MAALASGCGSSSGTSSSKANGPTATVAAAATRSGGLIIDVNGDLANPLFGSVKQGADAAAKQLGLNYQYSAPPNENNFVADYSALIREAIGRHPAAMVIGDFVPSAFDPLIKRATAAGIPVVLMNTGISTWQSDGAIGFVGEDGLVSGQAGGTGAVEAGIHHLLCVNEEPLNPVLHQRCQGTGQKIAAAGGTMAELDIPTVDATNGPATTQDIEGYLRSHSQIDGVETLGPLTAVYALAALKALGETGKIKVGTFDVSSAVLQDIKQGKLFWAVDQQPYLQGFDSLQIAAQYVRYKIRPLSPILTSGIVVNSSNVDQVLAVQSQYPGLRGLE